MLFITVENRAWPSESLRQHQVKANGILNSVLQQSESNELHQVPNCTELDSFVNMSELKGLHLITSMTPPTSSHSTLGGYKLSQTETAFTFLFVHDTTESSIKLLFSLSFDFVSKTSMWCLFAKALIFPDQTLLSPNTVKYKWKIKWNKMFKWVT